MRGRKIAGTRTADPEGADRQRDHKHIERTDRRECSDQNEHDLLFAAIRNDTPYNETERSANSCLTAIMGRMACESGQLIAWNEALNSNVERRLLGDLIGRCGRLQ